MEKYPSKREYVRGKLKKFLIEKNALKAFIENAKEQNKEKRGHKNINKAFVWLKTKEGVDYWYGLAVEFGEGKKCKKII